MNAGREFRDRTSEKTKHFGCMYKERPDSLLQELIKQSSNSEPLKPYSFGVTQFCNCKAANSPTYSKSASKLSISTQGSDNKNAKTSRLVSFLIKMLKRFFCHCFWVLVACLLSFRLFLSIDDKCQNKYSPTLNFKFFINWYCSIFTSLCHRKLNHAILKLTYIQFFRLAPACTCS